MSEINHSTRVFAEILRRTRQLGPALRIRLLEVLRRCRERSADGVEAAVNREVPADDLALIMALANDAQEHPESLGDVGALLEGDDELLDPQNRIVTTPMSLGRIWTYSRDGWRPQHRWRPFFGADEYGRRTGVLPIPFGGYLVIAYRTCRCAECERMRGER